MRFFVRRQSFITLEFKAEFFRGSLKNGFMKTFQLDNEFDEMKMMNEFFFKRL
jgi:hypothetical protein